MSSKRVPIRAAFLLAALGAEDRWSDIDLALGLAADADLGEVMADWTQVMYRDHGAVDHLDIAPRATVYRVFLLASTLQVDLAFSPAAEFGAIAPTFRLIFGTPAERPQSPPPGAAELVGMGWVYALHARSSIARGRAWQAEYMISGVRDHVLALACLRHGVPAVQGRGMDRLPPASPGWAPRTTKPRRCSPRLARSMPAWPTACPAPCGSWPDGRSCRPVSRPAPATWPRTSRRRPGRARPACRVRPECRVRPGPTGPLIKLA